VLRQKALATMKKSAASNTQSGKLIAADNRPENFTVLPGPTYCC